jgi:hypothetical protein
MLLIMRSVRFLVVFLLLGLAWSASAEAGTRSFTLTAPANACPGQQTLRVMLTNTADQQQLGSAEITIPGGLEPVGQPTLTARTGSVSRVGQTIRLRDLALQPASSPPTPSSTATISVTVKVPGATAMYTWGVIAKQSNDFNGLPGNNMSLDQAGSSLNTSVTGNCSLRFGRERQPTDATVNTNITSVPFDPNGPPVTVEVVDGAGGLVDLPARITLTLQPNPFGGLLTGTLTVTASGGVAPFPTLKIDKAGQYVLTATSPDLPGVTAQSAPFDIASERVVVECEEGADCTGSLGANAGYTYEVTALANARVDLLTLAFFAGQLNCAGYDELSPNTLTFDVTSRAKRVTVTVSKALMNSVTNNGAAFLQLCYGSPVDFRSRLGTVQDPATHEFVGLLPDCASAEDTRCIESRNKTQAGQGVIVARLPSGDPRIRG